MRKLFDILSWKRDEDFIIVDISENRYTTSNTIVIQDYKFEKYLKRLDKFYFETHDISTGQYQAKANYMTFDEYFDYLTYEEVAEDLYDYISIRHIDFDKAYQITNNAIQSLMKYFNL
jgi:hypothetical protein